MRPNPAFKAEEVIMGLGVGEALTSFLDENGVPSIAQRTAIICPQSLMAPASEAMIKNLMEQDGMAKYDMAFDRESAYEILNGQAEQEAAKEQLRAEREQLEKEKAAFEAKKQKEELAAQKRKEKEEEAARKKQEKAAERRKAQIERQLINTGAQVLKRGLLKTLLGK